MSRLTNMLSLFGQLLLFMNLLPAAVQVSWWGILLLILAPQLAVLAQLGLSRTREYDADLNAAALTGDPGGLASALVKIERRQRRLLDLLLPGWGLPEPSWLRPPQFTTAGADPPSARVRASGGGMAPRIASRVAAGGAGCGVAPRPPASLSCERIVVLTLTAEAPRAKHSMNETQTSWTKARQRFSDEWSVLTFYERFEQVVALILANVIAVVVVMSLVQIIRALIVLLASEAFNLLDHAAFQSLFGMIMTLLIAMEFKHSHHSCSIAPRQHYPSRDRGRDRPHRLVAQIRHSRYRHYRGCADRRLGGSAAGPGRGVLAAARAR